MTDYTIEKLTEMKIEEHFNNLNDDKKYYKFNKMQLINFCIKMMKVIKEVEME